ncbi:MAG: hypothetical protein ABI824_07705, partial [Acidobacteriota bacterium]
MKATVRDDSTHKTAAQPVLCLLACLLVSLLTANSALAQNNDLAVLGGWSTTQGTSVTPLPGTSGSGLLVKGITTTSPSFQISYARQLVEGAVDPYGHQTVALALELPLVVAIRDNATTVLNPISQVVIGGSGTDLFFTPGLRIKIFQAALVSASGSVGFGVASFAPQGSIFSSTSLSTGTRQNPESKMPAPAGP